MPKFIAVHTLPMTKEKWLSSFKTDLTFPKGFSWNQTYCDFKDGKFFCEWEAPSKAKLKQGLKSMLGFPLDDVYPVEVYNVAKKDFES